MVKQVPDLQITDLLDYLQSDVPLDILPQFSSASINKDLLTVENKLEDIAKRLIALLTTEKGSLPKYREFGNPVYEYLFELSNDETREKIRSRLQEELQRFIGLNCIVNLQQISEKSITVTIEFRTGDYGIRFLFLLELNLLERKISSAQIQNIQLIEYTLVQVS